MLAPTPLADGPLATLAFRLGADVPFLTSELPLALAWGRGERLMGLRPLPAREVLLYVPSFGVETAAAFAWIAESRREAALAAAAPMTMDDLDRWDGITRLAQNDLEAPVFQRHPELAVGLKRLLDAGARIARMSGSGSTLFGVFDRRPPALTGLPPGVRIVHTRTATSTPAVRVLD